MASGESDTHKRLKEVTFLWACQRGYRCCAMEVRAPRSPYRVDLAAVRIDRRTSLSTSAIFECKQSRNDFMRDNRRSNDLRNRLAELQDRRRKLELLLAVHYPSLRTSDCLFPDWISFDFGMVDHQGYRQTVQNIVRVQRQLLQDIKFDLISRYCVANLHYLVAPPGIIDPAEVPIGWGFLEVAAEGTIEERTLPIRFSHIGTTDWLVCIAKASTGREIRSILARKHSQKRLKSVDQSQTPDALHELVVETSDL
jgi:hypothetical protein